MQVRTLLRHALFSAAVVVPLFAHAAGNTHFLDGESVYGNASKVQPGERVVDVRSAKSINVEYGQTVDFRNGDKQFAWNFDGLGDREVDLSKIAPNGFGASGMKIYVDRNPEDVN